MLLCVQPVAANEDDVLENILDNASNQFTIYKKMGLSHQKHKMDNKVPYLNNFTHLYTQNHQTIFTDKNTLQIKQLNLPNFNKLSSIHYAGLKSITGKIAYASASQLFGANHVDWSNTGEEMLLTVVAETSQNQLKRSIPVWATRNQDVISNLTRTIGLGHTGLTSQLLASSTGILVSDIIYAYGGAMLGLHNFETANVMTAISTLSLTSGTLAYSGLMAYAMAFGTASTGTAISSLSGAAATNAALAWFGGGAISAGGGGMAAGATVLGLTTAGVGVVFTVVAWTGYDWYNRSQDNHRIASKLVKYESLPAFQAIQLVK
jgi:hypothetical protein